jgi:hypothetical protein
MATKKPMPFAGKESKREEAMEKKMPAKKYKAGEMKEAAMPKFRNGGMAKKGKC